MNENILPLIRLLPPTLLLGLAFTAQAANDGDSDGDGRPSACERTAGQIFQACKYDVRDNYNLVIANCLNLATRQERRACRDDARVESYAEQEDCRDVREARKDVCAVLGEDRYDLDPLLDPTISFIDPDDVPGIYAPNPYVSVAAGHTFVLRGGEEGQETVVVHVTGDSREIQDVLCRVVLDVVVEVGEENGVLEYTGVESTDDWFAQDTFGNVYYCGEIARNYEDGVLRNLDGSFEAGYGSSEAGWDIAKAGELIRAFPVARDAHRQEFALGEAEDVVQYVDVAAAPTAEEGGDNLSFPCSPDQCLKTFEFSALGHGSTEYKYHLPGTGFVLAVAMEDGELTGEREELVCVGDSLDVLADPACEIADPDALLETLCEMAPGPFCE